MTAVPILTSLARLAWERSATETDLRFDDDSIDIEDAVADLEPGLSEELEATFFEALERTDERLSIITRERLVVDTEPPEAVFDLVDQFDEAIAAAIPETNRHERRYSVLSALVAVLRSLDESADGICRVAAAGTGMEPPTTAALQSSVSELETHLESTLGDGPADADQRVETHRQRGETQFDSGSFHEAADSFRSVLLLESDDAAAHAGLGAALARSRDLTTTEATRRHLQRALELDPGNTRALRYHASFRWDHDGEDAGRDAFEQALEQAPTNERLYRTYAERLRDAGEPDDAAEIYERGLETVGADHVLRRYYARFLATLQRFDQAQAQFERAIEDDRIDPVARIWFGHFHDQRGMPELARPYLEAGFEMIDAGFGDVDLDTFLPSLVRLVEILEQVGEDDAVVRWCEYALDNGDEISDNEDALQTLEERYNSHRPPADDSTGSTDETETPTESETTDEMSANGNAMADTDASLDEQVAAAIEHDTGDITDPDTLAEIGHKYRKTEAQPLASVYFEQALEQDQGHANAHFGLARLASAADPPDKEAVYHHYKRAIERDPDALEIRRLFADTLATWDNRDVAETQFEAALDIDPDDPMTRCWYGSHCKSWGDTDDARTHLERGLTADKTRDELGTWAAITWATALVELCERDGDSAAVREWCRYGLSACDNETQPPGTEKQEQLEETLEQYADTVPTPWNRRDDSKFEQWWYLTVNGDSANVVVSVNGTELEWTTTSSSFSLSLPLNEIVDDDLYEIEVTVLRTIVEDSYDGSQYTDCVSEPDELSVDIAVNSYAAGEVVNTLDDESIMEASCDPGATETLPQTVALTLDTTTE